MISYIVEKKGKLIKLSLEYCLDLSFTSLMKALRKKDVKVNGKRVSEDVALSIGDKVEIYCTTNLKEKFFPVYKDDNILIVNKKSGYTSESVYNDLKEKEKSVYFIHRLDRNTEGLMVFALNEKANEELLKGFKNRTFEKEYLALVKGKVKKNEELLINYLVKDQVNSTVKIFDKKVKGSVEIKTGYRVVKRNEDTTILSVKLYTGKTHQIRAHLSYIGYPIVGDGKYGDNSFNKKFGAKRQMLKAYKITFHFDKEENLYYLNGKTFKLES